MNKRMSSRFQRLGASDPPVRAPLPILKRPTIQILPVISWTVLNLGRKITVEGVESRCAKGWEGCEGGLKIGRWYSDPRIPIISING